MAAAVMATAWSGLAAIASVTSWDAFAGLAPILLT